MLIYDKNGPERIRDIVYFTALVMLVGYQIANVFLPNAEMIVYVRVFAVSVFTSLLYILARDFWDGLRRPQPLPRDFLICGIWLSFLSGVVQNVYAIVYRLSGTPAWLLNNELLSPTILVSVIGAILHIITPGSIKEGHLPAVPRRNRYALGIGLGMGVLVIGLFLTSKPDLAPYVEPLRPYIGDWWQTGRILGTEPT